MSKLNGTWIEAFKAGDYGANGVWTEGDLQKIASSYDPKLHEAPVVKGHPAHDAPAFGWIDAVKAEGKNLFVRLNQVPAEFEELVRDGRFKKRSVALYTKFAKTGGPYLRHVGFLGAMPPEVKGLRDVAFSEGEFHAINFQEEATMNEEIKKAFEEMFAKVKALFEGKTEQKEGAAAEMQEKLTAALKPFQDQIAQMEAKFAEQQKTAASANVTSLVTDAISKLKAANKWVPAFDEMKVPAIFTELASSSAKVTFGEGDKKTEKAPLQVFTEFLEALPKIVPTSEIAKAAAKTSGTLVKFNEPAGGTATIDSDSVELAEAATELSTKEKIPFGDALKRVREQVAAKAATV